MPASASYVNIQSAMHKRLGLDFPGCLRGKLIVEQPDMLTPPDLFEAFKLHNFKEYREYTHLMSAQQRDELYAFKGVTMDRIQAGNYSDPPKNFMAGAATRSEQWNFLTPMIKLKISTSCSVTTLDYIKTSTLLQLSCARSTYSRCPAQFWTRPSLSWNSWTSTRRKCKT